ncbi:MAG: SdrD B-like domain-containing protein [Beduini sp.]|uniref:SdrD B-like domain-containing protein n=1 Tax=Beduini sp. TaxID=1922300 RepID=UPI0039A281F1
MNVGKQDSTLYKQGNTLALTKTTQDKGYVGSSFEELNGYIIPAYHNTETDNVNTATVINGYDIVKSRDLEHYNIGFTDKVGGQIKGTIFDDENYDGFYGESEAGINGIDVYLEQYYLLDDGTWTLNKEDYAQTQTQTLNGKDGLFLFDAVPTHITAADGTVHLASYKVKVGDIPEIYGITYLNMRSQDSTDIYDETRDSDLVAATHYLTSGDGKKTTEEYILTAYPLRENDPRNEDYIYTYNGQDYDILDNQTINDFDGGLVQFKQGSIEGDVWLDSSDDLDTNYDGIKNDNEPGIADQTVILSQYLLKNGKWELVEDGDLFTTTNENGHYLFADLPVYKEEDDGTRYLYGYQLKLDMISEEYAVTKYRQGDDPVKDSDLNVETSRLTEANEYIILAHDATHDDYINKPYTIKVDNGWLKSASYYDILVGEHNKDYSAGYVEYQLGSIEGTAFEDADYDGIYNNSDQVKAEVLVKLKRYYYNSDERKWIEDNRSPRVIGEEADDYEKTEKPESIYRQMLTDKNGHYIFDNLETYKEIDGKRYIYGYQLWIGDIPQGTAVTKYQQNNGENDSALKADTKQLMKADMSLPEMNSGYLTVAENVSQESYQNTHYVIGKYDTIAAKSLTDYNAGFTSIDTGSISGIVWEDEDKNGIRHETEKGMADIEVILETYYYQQGKWQQLKDKVVLKAITSEEGKYEFNHLSTYGYIDEELVLYGYKVKIENYPNDYEVTSYHANDMYLDSDLNGNTGYLSEYEELMVLASKADQTIDPMYTINGYNIVKASNIHDLDAGFSLYDPEYETVIENVDTGDRNQLMGVAGLLALSGIAFIVLNKKKKEKNEKE